MPRAPLYLSAIALALLVTMGVPGKAVDPGIRDEPSTQPVAPQPGGYFGQLVREYAKVQGRHGRP